MVKLKARLLRKQLPTKGCRKFGNDRQLLINTVVELLNGEEQKMNFLVDTGAEANLIRQVLVSDHLMYCEKDPLNLKQQMAKVWRGGGRQVHKGENKIAGGEK